MNKKCSELISEHYQYMKNVLGTFKKPREWIEDVAQEACIKAITKFDQCQDHDKFRAWFVSIAINTAKNILRDSKGDRFCDIEDLKIASNEMNSEEMAEQNQLLDFVSVEVMKLPRKQRLAFIKRFVDEDSFKEISEEMKCCYDTAKANYRHSILKLRPDLSTYLNKKRIPQ